jgi:hypothetical protein
MIKNSIGENAGKIWKALEENSDFNVKELKKATKLNDNDLHLALGWLSKENKVIFFESSNELKIRLLRN